MLNNDFKYFTGRTETSNHENQNNKKNLEVKRSQQSKTSGSSFFDLLDNYNPFGSTHREGFESSVCPPNAEAMSEIITQIRESGKSLQEQKTILLIYLNSCSEGFNGVESLINIQTTDLIKNEIQRVELLIQIEIDFDNLDVCLKKLVCYMLPYLATGHHPSEIIERFGYTFENGKLSEIYSSAQQSLDFIRANYGNLFGETPTEFINGIDIILNGFIKYFIDNRDARQIMECQPILTMTSKNARATLGIDNIKRDNNNVLCDGYYLYEDIATVKQKCNIVRRKLANYLKSINELDKSGGMNVGGKDFTMFVTAIVDRFEVEHEKQDNFIKFPTGFSTYYYVENNPDFKVNDKNFGIIHHMAAWTYALEIYTYQRTYLTNIQGQFFSLYSYSSSISNNTPAQVTTYIKEFLKRLDESIDEMYVEDSILSTNYLSAQQFKDKLSFRKILEDSCYNSDYQQCCYYLKTLNESTGLYYASCQSFESIMSEVKNTTYENGLLKPDGNNLGLSQYYIYMTSTILLYCNYMLCSMLRDSYCEGALSASQQAEADSQSQSIRDIITKQIDFAAASTSRPTNSSMAVPSMGSYMESFISGREGFEGNRKMIIGETKFTDTVSNIIKNFDFNLDGKQQTLESYTKDKINMTTCVPENTPYFSANYKCGTQVNDNPISSAILSDNVSFNCADPENEKNDVYKCNTFFFELDDNGNVSVKQGEEVMWSKTFEIDDFERQFILAGKMNASLKNPPNILLSGQNLENGEFLSSPNKTFNLVNENGKLILKYMFSPCLRDPSTSSMYGYYDNAEGTKHSIGMYHVDDVNINHIGKSGHVNLNGELQLYDNPGYSNAYLNVGNYTTSQHTNNVLKKPSTDDQIISSEGGASVMYNTSSAAECADKCNEFEECGGYVISGNNCMLKTDQMFPVGLRKSDPNSRMYVRMKGVPNGELDGSCVKISKDENMTNKMYDQYDRSGNILPGFRDIKQGCDLVEARKPYYDEYMRTKAILDEAKKNLSESLNTLNEKDIQNLEKYNVNVKQMQDNIEYQDQLQKDTYRKMNNVNTTETANDDIHKQMNQNLQAMFVYSALTVGLLGVTFAVM